MQKNCAHWGQEYICKKTNVILVTRWFNFNNWVDIINWPPWRVSKLTFQTLILRQSEIARKSVKKIRPFKKHFSKHIAFGNSVGLRSGVRFIVGTRDKKNVFCEKSCTSFIFLLDSNKWTLIVCIYQDLLLHSSTPLVPFWNFSTPLWKMTVGIRSTVIVIVPSSFNRKEGVKLFWIFFRSTNSYAGLFNNSIINNIKESQNKRKEKITVNTTSR